MNFATWPSAVSTILPPSGVPFVLTDGQLSRPLMAMLFSLPGAPQQPFVQLWYPAATYPSAVGREPG